MRNAQKDPSQSPCTSVRSVVEHQSSNVVADNCSWAAKAGMLGRMVTIMDKLFQNRKVLHWEITADLPRSMRLLRLPLSLYNHIFHA